MAGLVIRNVAANYRPQNYRPPYHSLGIGIDHEVTRLPTGFKCGALNGPVQPGSVVAIVGAGPIGLAALLTAHSFKPAEIIMVDVDDNRLAISKRFGATATVNSGDGTAVETIMHIK